MEALDSEHRASAEAPRGRKFEQIDEDPAHSTTGLGIRLGGQSFNSTRPEVVLGPRDSAAEGSRVVPGAQTGDGGDPPPFIFVQSTHPRTGF